MNQVSNEDLILLFYGEHDDPSLAATVAASPELSARFDKLCDELKSVDAFVPPHRGTDYGAEVWQLISPQLATEQASPDSRWKAWLASLAQPRFGLAGTMSIMLVAVLAFMLGRNSNQEGPGIPAQPLDGTAIAGAIADIDADRLLSSSVSGHLEQVNLVLTQFANSEESSPSETEFATDMLVANRLYRNAAELRGNHKLATFLATLEPLLIELAYEAQSNSPATRERMQQEVRDSLLFRVRVMNKQLNHSEISL